MFYISSTGADCMNTMSDSECEEAGTSGKCNDIDWATENCAKTCDLCCDLC